MSIPFQYLFLTLPTPFQWNVKIGIDNGSRIPYYKNAEGAKATRYVGQTKRQGSDKPGEASPSPLGEYCGVEQPSSSQRS
jgi:hypothetical protein